jgi:Uma2 family endonuclease
VLERAPKICVEIISPSNTAAEIEEKRALYFEAGAQEGWTCGLDGELRFQVAPVDASRLCPAYLKRSPNIPPTYRTTSALGSVDILVK